MNLIFRTASIFRRCSALLALIFAVHTAHAAPRDRFEIDIPAGSLNDSLLLLGEQARLSIVFGKEAVAPFQNASVKGDLPAEDALIALLAESCLTYEFIRESLVALKAGCAPPTPPAPPEPPPVPAAPAPPQHIEEIVVRERPVTGSRLTQAGVRTPVPVDVITRPEIELSGHQSLGQILRYLPAVSGNATSTLVTNGGDGTATVTLRGLPASNTLVLLNGRRMNPEALHGSAVDLNTLPIALIERIEVLKDGASAVYGSDAVAGVVNVMTRRDLRGFHADAYVGQADAGDLDTRNASVTYSHVGEGLRITGGATYYEQEPVYSRDRSLSRSSDDRPRGGIDKRSSSTTPARIYLPTGPVVFDGGAYRAATAEDRFEYRDFTTLIVPSRRYSLFLDSEWQVGSTTWFAEFLGSRTSSDNTFAPTPLFTGFEKLPLNIDANQAFNPFGMPLFDVRRRIVEAGTRRLRNESDTRRAVLGARGNIDGVEWELSVQQSRTEAEEVLRGAVDAFAVQQALTDACSAPCTPLDVFGAPGSINADQLGFIEAQTRSTGTSRIRAANLNLDFVPAALPAGEIQVVTGIEYRQEWLHTDPDARLAEGGIIGSSNFAPTEGQRRSWEGFAEVRVPLVRDLPAIYRLDAYLAGRLSSYDDIGRETNPRILLHYQPDSRWSLRVSYAHGFRAPNLIEVFGGTSRSFQQLNDPCSLPSNVAAMPGCAVQSDPSLTQFLTVKGGNTDLLPERSRNFSAGVEFYNRFDFGEVRVSVDRYRIRQRNVVDTNAQLIVNENANGNGFDDRVVRDANGNITRVLATHLNIGERDVSGYDLTARLSLEDSPLGQFRIALNATHISKFVDRISPSVPTVDHAGTFRDSASGGNGALPDWKASLGVSWQREHWRAQYNLFYVSSLEEVVPIYGIMRDIEAWTTHNAQVSYLGPMTGWFRVSVGVNNLFDEEPPFSAAAFNDSYDSRTYDMTGRYGYLRLERSI